MKLIQASSTIQGPYQKKNGLKLSVQREEIQAIASEEALTDEFFKLILSSIIIKYHLCFGPSWPLHFYGHLFSTEQQVTASKARIIWGHQASRLPLSCAEFLDPSRHWQELLFASRNQESYSSGIILRFN